MSNKFRYHLNNFLALSKLKIMIPVSLTGFTGYFVYKPAINVEVIILTAGILLLAISASVLNQIQESDTDRKMNRTRNRPIPSGKVSTRTAIWFFLATLMSGSVLVIIASNYLVLIIGLTTVAWYNGIYTNLKRVTAFAVFPGAVTGALPPLMGWLAAGGSPFDRTIIFIEFLFFIGQIPHFWLLMLLYGDEYSNAGLPSLTKILNKNQIGRLIFVWVLASASASVFLFTFQIIRTLAVSIILLTATITLVIRFRKLVNLNAATDYRRYPMMLNLYFLLVIILLISDRIAA